MTVSLPAEMKIAAVILGQLLSFVPVEDCDGAALKFEQAVKGQMAQDAV